jgi:hypothetical protein
MQLFVRFEIVCRESCLALDCQERGLFAFSGGERFEQVGPGDLRQFIIEWSQADQRCTFYLFGMSDAIEERKRGTPGVADEPKPRFSQDAAYGLEVCQYVLDVQSGLVQAVQERATCAPQVEQDAVEVCGERLGE